MLGVHHSSVYFYFILPRDAMHSAAYAVVRCPTVRLFVCLSVTFVYSVGTTKHIFKFFSPPGSDTVLVFRTEPYGNILTGTTLTGALNADG